MNWQWWNSMSDVEQILDNTQAAAPRSLLARPTTRYRGTDIDGPTLEPEGLWVRGKSLNELIGTVDFETALWHLWHEVFPNPEQLQAMRDRLDAFSQYLATDPQAIRAAAAAAAHGVDAIFATATGLMRGTEEVITAANLQSEEPRHHSWDDDFDQLLACIAMAPYAMRAALGNHTIGNARNTSHALRMATLMGVDAEEDAEIAAHVLDALLVAWHAGFGYITPTVLVPRCVIGTGVSLAQAVAAGFMASGPNHVGAAQEAMRWLATVAAEDNEGTGASAVDDILDDKQKFLFGFGHPLFIADPRPPHLRALFNSWGFAGKHLALFDTVCNRAKERKGLNPNIDFITAAALLDLGIRDSRWGVGLGLCARIAAMTAHAVERRRRPAFGVNSATARKLLAAVPAGWL
jgi:citrate synthase